MKVNFYVAVTADCSYNTSLLNKRTESSSLLPIAPLDLFLTT